MLQEEYYIIEGENNNNYPMFSWDQFENEYGLGKPVAYSEPLKFRLMEPISRNFEWVDYHELPQPVISKRILDALIPLDLYGVQFIPAKVRNQKNPSAKLQDYWFVHIWNNISCLDRENSVFDSYDDGDIFDIEKLILKEKTLAGIELEKRLIFELSEDCTILLVHEKVKEAIMSVEPKGVRFIKATEWYSDICFDD